MQDATATLAPDEHIRRLEEALAEYSVRYGLTERARRLFQEGAQPVGETKRERAALTGGASLFRRDLLAVPALSGSFDTRGSS